MVGARRWPGRRRSSSFRRADSRVAFRLGWFDERVTLVADNVRDRVGKLADLDAASQVVLIEVLRGLEKQRWVLRAHRA